MIERCETCRFFIPWGNPREQHIFRGTCRRYPPQVHNVGYGHTEQRTVALAAHPDVNVGDWCGEWQDKDPAPLSDECVAEVVRLFKETGRAPVVILRRPT